MSTRTHATMPLGDHLEELRRRLIFGFLGLIPLLALTLTFGTTILEFLSAPAYEALRDAGQPAKFQSLGPFEVFSAYLKVSLVTALVAGAPWLLYQLWLFVAPGLYERERRFVHVLLPLSALLTIAGAVFLYRVVMPLLLIFLIRFGADIGARSPGVGPVPAGVVLAQVPVLDHDPESPQVGQMWVNSRLKELRVCTSAAGPDAVVEGMELHTETGISQHYRLSEYISVFTTLALAFVAAFQTPVVILLLGWSGFVTPAFFTKYRRHAVLVCTVAAALLSPGDPASLFSMMVVLYLLYELGIFLVRVLPAHRVAAGFTRAQRERTPALPEDDDHTP